jgi:hypothetical protein
MIQANKAGRSFFKADETRWDVLELEERKLYIKYRFENCGQLLHSMAHIGSLDHALNPFKGAYESIIQHFASEIPGNTHWDSWGERLVKIAKTHPFLKMIESTEDT